MDKGELELSEQLFRVRQSVSNVLRMKLVFILCDYIQQASREVLRSCEYIECVEPVRYRIGADSFMLSAQQFYECTCCSTVKASSDSEWFKVARVTLVLTTLHSCRFD